MKIQKFSPFLNYPQMYDGYLNYILFFKNMSRIKASDTSLSFNRSFNLSIGFSIPGSTKVVRSAACVLCELCVSVCYSKCWLTANKWVWGLLNRLIEHN